MRLYDGDRRTEFENGVLEVTSHRLIWRRVGSRLTEYQQQQKGLARK